MKNCTFLALSLIAITGGCADRKPSFSRAQFLAAKARCGATDAYILEKAPNTIAFHGISDAQVEEARCLKARLAGTDVQTIVLGVEAYKVP